MIKKIINFLNEDELKIVSQYFKFANKFFDKEYSNPAINRVKGGSFTSNPDFVAESILLAKKEIVEEAVGEKVLPTYSYSRLYINGSELIKHVDRPSCEVSITLNIFGDKDWKIYMRPKNSSVEPLGLTTQPGEGVLYEGMKYQHWREKYTGEKCMQIFLHYVRANGEYKQYYKDKRAGFGTKK